MSAGFYIFRPKTKGIITQADGNPFKSAHVAKKWLAEHASDYDGEVIQVLKIAEEFNVKLEPVTQYTAKLEKTTPVAAALKDVMAGETK